jgi:uncharacterized protein YkwD
MDVLRIGTVLCLAVASSVLMGQTRITSGSEYGKSEVVQSAGQLFALANQTRASHGLGPLKWDSALAAGAQQHCLRMAQEGPIAHRYGGELDLTERAGRAGAHFSLIEENIAVGASAAGIHQGWMNSRDHRDNLLNPGIDRVGIAVMARGGAIYAVADYSRAVPVLTQAQVEATFAGMLHSRGLTIDRDSSSARAYCASTGRYKGADGPSFLVRWQSPDVTQLPQELAKRVASGGYREAAVGSCAPQNVEGGFTLYRVAVFLYGQDSAAWAKPSY